MLLVVITAAGGTCWELCYMATPFAVLTLGAMGNTNARRLHERGAALDLGDLGSIGAGSLKAALPTLMSDAGRRRTMAAAAAVDVAGVVVDEVNEVINSRMKVSSEVKQARRSPARLQWEKPSLRNAVAVVDQTPKASFLVKLLKKMAL